MSTNVQHRPTAHADVPAIARLHHAVIRDTLHARQGASFLEELYHGVLDCPDTTCWVAEEDGRILGFLSLAWDLHRAEQQLRAALSPRTKLRSAAHVATTPAELLAFLRHRTLLRATRRRFPNPYVTIMTLGVDPSRQGGGLGRGLVRHAERASQQRGVPTLHVDTSQHNHAAIAFYERCGFDRAGVYGGFAVLGRAVGPASPSG